MRPRRLEVRRIALRVLVKMDRVLSRRQIPETHLHLDRTLSCFPQNRRAHNLALSILELY